MHSQVDLQNRHSNTSDLKGSRILVDLTPDWVLPAEIPEVARREDDITTNIFIDQQINAEQTTSYFRNRKRLETPMAVQAESQIEISFDPCIQKLIIHEVNIIRNGHTVSNEAQLDKIKLIQREQSLEAKIYDGNITSLIILNDVRSGDEVDLSYSIINDNWLFDNHFWRTSFLQHYLPIGLTRVVWYGPNKPFSQASIDDIDYSFTEGYHIWQRRDTPPLKLEEGIPNSHLPIDHLSLSTYDNWCDVQSQINQQWMDCGQLPIEAISLVDTISDESESTDEIIERIVRWVRTEVRYQGFEVGHLAIKPAPLEQIWGQRYGDCKEKSSLLVALLRQASIEAYVALVNTHEGKLIKDRLPSPGAFDHAIVLIIHEGNEYWVDATNTLQRGGLVHWTGIYHLSSALVIRANNKPGLIDLPEPNNKRNWLQIADNYEINATAGTANLTITHRVSGVEAETIRSILEHQGRAKLQGLFIDWVKGIHPKADLIKDLEITNFDEKNQCLITGEFFIKELIQISADGHEQGITFSPYSIIDRVVGSNGEARVYPLALSYPCRIGQVTRIKYDEPFSFTAKSQEVDSEFFLYKFSVEKDGQDPVLRYHYEAKADLVPAHRIAAYHAQLMRSEGITSWGIYKPIAATGSGDDFEWDNPKTQTYSSSSSSRQTQHYRQQRKSRHRIGGANIWVLIFLVFMFVRIVAIFFK